MGEATIAAPLPQWANAPAVTPVARLSLQESILRAFARNPDVTQQAAQIGSVTGSEGARRVGNLLEGFAQGQVSAGNTPLAYQREHLLQGQLFGVVQTQAKLDHRKLLLALLLAR